MTSYHLYNIRKKLKIQSSENLVMDGRTDRQADRQTYESDFIGGCATFVRHLILTCFTKDLASKLKSARRSLIASQQTTYVQNIRRSISCIFNISDKLNVDGYLVNVDIEKSFDCLHHSLLLVVLKNLALVIASFFGLKYY